MTAQLLFEAYRIPHNEQRYETAGDWQAQKDGSCHITVSRLPDPRYEILVAIHELIEATLCAQRGIKQSDVDTFDQLFEHERGNLGALHGPDDEPGDDPRAPYRRQHRIATAIEMLLATEMGVDWADYERELANASS